MAVGGGLSPPTNQHEGSGRTLARCLHRPVYVRSRNEVTPVWTALQSSKHRLHDESLCRQCAPLLFCCVLLLYSALCVASSQFVGTCFSRPPSPGDECQRSREIQEFWLCARVRIPWRSQHPAARIVACGIPRDENGAQLCND